MTGRDIQNKITDTTFFIPNVLIFQDEKKLKLDNSDSALEFSTLFAVLLRTAESDYTEYDEGKLLQTYNFVYSALRARGQIASTDFLSNPPNFYISVRENTCFMSETPLVFIPP